MPNFDEKIKQHEITAVFMVFCIAEYKVRYDPYGQISEKTTGINEYDIFFGFNGEEYNPVTDTQYLRARYYAPEIGNFLSQDTILGTISNLNSQNRYTFAENDPVNNVDPSGHAAVVNYAHARNMAANGSIDEILNMSVAGALSQWESKASSAFYGQLYKAQGVSYQDIEAINNISGISQATANYYIQNGGLAALKAAISLNCVPGEIVNGTIRMFETNVNATNDSVNVQIASVKNRKLEQHKEWVVEQERIRRAQYIDIISDLHNLMVRLEYKHTIIIDSSGRVKRISEVLSVNSRLTDFLFKSLPNSDYDLKTKDGWKTEVPVIYEGKVVAPDASGNILYGYMGKAYGFSDDTIYNAAGIAQIISGTTTKEWVFFGNGDDPFDQYYISLGIDYYNRLH